jgi:phosphoribosylformylglycinamidine cyclo-ligase
LARKLFFEVGGYSADSYVDELGSTVGEALLATHASFLPQIGTLLDSGFIKGLVHITGGGFLENIPRILPEGVSVEIRRGTWPELPIFGMMQRLGNVDEKEMFRTFNMGIGMIVVASAENAVSIGNDIDGCLEIGRVLSGNKEIILS